MMGITSRRIWLITWLIVIAITLGGCSKASSESVFLTIDDNAIHEDEVMLYLLQTFNEFEQLGGEDVWDITDFSGGKSASDVAKQGALDNLIMTKVLVKRAEELNIFIDDSVEADLLDQAQTYFDNLSASFVEKFNITIEVVRRVLTDNQLAAMVEQETKDSYEVTLQAMGAKKMANEEYVWLTEQISKGVELILTVYTIEHIVVYTHSKDQDGQWVALEVKQQTDARDKIDEALMELDGGAAFDEVALTYSEDESLSEATMQTNVSKLQIPSQFSEVLEGLEVGMYSEVIVGDSGLHIFRLIEKALPTHEDIETFEASFSEWEDALEEEARNAIVNDGFENLYKKWRQNVDVTIEEPWSQVDVLSVGTIE